MKKVYSGSQFEGPSQQGYHGDRSVKLLVMLHPQAGTGG